MLQCSNRGVRSGPEDALRRLAFAQALAPADARQSGTMPCSSANGWAWLDEWAPAGRFRPVYVPGGVVTGRWASSGGGALQLPRQLRPAVRADPGWTLVVADVAALGDRHQIEHGQRNRFGGWDHPVVVRRIAAGVRVAATCPHDRFD